MLEKRYDPRQVEADKYEKWKQAGYFTAGKDKSKPPFSLVIPPPNVTGKLHLGHAMDTTLEDIVSRYKRAKGYDVLWVPGVDHAGIATQAKVEEKLRKEEGVSRYELGREEFLRRAYAWKDEYAATIHSQWASLGLSVDYSRERFTLDEGLSAAVRKVFVTLYNEGLIYQGERIINWDPELRTALSNIEVVHTEDQGEFYYFKYDVVGEKDRYLIVATTRPETMFGDTAVFVNPKDKRYKDLVGKKVINPANGEALPIMADPYVDISFGTGAMKCTPAHDPNDFQLAKKYGFPFIKVLDETAHMNEKAGKYAKMDRYECRQALTEDIKRSGHLLKIEKITHAVGHSERSGAIVEPMLSKQWFVKMKPLAERLLANQKGADRVEFIPKRFEKVLLRWMNEVDDWCISRQLWWGHRIPAYTNKKTGELIVSETPLPSDLYSQDEDVLDTWFSSGLWPFATLGWPDTKNPDFERYFPTSVLVTGYDIIFFWVSRMIFQSLHFTGKAPFHQVLIHGLVRDSQGRKMSKSLGNGVDPNDVIAKYGADAMRLFITTSGAPGLDMRYSEEKVEASANYLNKIWNATRYVEGVLGEGYTPALPDPKKLSAIDKAVLSKLERTIKKVTEKMDRYEFGQASSALYDFVYDDFCSSYLEMSKVSLQNKMTAAMSKDTLFYVLKAILLMIYPYCPFIAEELYLSLPTHRASIMEESYPVYERKYLFAKEEKAVALLNKMIKDIRNYKSERGLPPNAEVILTLSPKEPFEGASDFLSRFCFAKKIAVSKENLPGAPFLYSELSMSVEEDIDPVALKEKLAHDLEKASFEIKRGEGLLQNPGFLKKAPQEKIKAEEDKLAKNKALYASIEERLKKL